MTFESTLGPDRDAAEIGRIERARQRTGESLQASLARLDAVAHGPRLGRAEIDGLAPAAAALAEVLAASGLSGAPAANADDRLARATSVGQAADALGVGTRQIVLPGRWWRGDFGHFVGFLRSGRGAEIPREERAVALLAHRGGYRLIDRRTGRRIRVTDYVAAGIEPSAIQPLARLPQSAASIASLARFLLPLIRADLRALLIAGALIGILGALVPIAAAVAVDTLIPGGEHGLLVQMGAALAIGALVTFAFAALRQRALVAIDGRTDLALQAGLWDRVMRLPASFFRSRPAGDLARRIAGIGELRSAAVGFGLSAAVTAVFSVFYLALLVWYDWRLALIAMALLAALMAATLLAGRAQARHHRRQAEIGGRLAGTVFQFLEGIAKLRVAAAEDRAFTRWAARYAEERSAIVAARRIGNRFLALSDAWAVLAMAVIFLAVARLAEAPVSPGIFIAFIAAFASLQGALDGLARAALAIVERLPDWDRARPIFEAEPEARVLAADPGPLAGAITIAGVTFAYPDGAPVVENVSLALALGEHVALVGPSGSGKSTLVRLILGLDRPQAGAILFDGQDLAGLDPTLVRRQIGVVTQNGRLFAGTIMDNVRGAREASHEDCLAALRQAGFGPDLADFPMGLHTPLTEGATTLSGGQRQRILIARALLGSPRILIFDEATSALDNVTQAVVADSLARLAVTRLTIAHRLSTVRHATRIHVIDRGSIAETGSHDELMARDEIYAALARRQLA